LNIKLFPPLYEVATLYTHLFFGGGLYVDKLMRNVNIST